MTDKQWRNTDVNIDGGVVLRRPRNQYPYRIRTRKISPSSSDLSEVKLGPIRLAGPLGPDARNEAKFWWRRRPKSAALECDNCRSAELHNAFEQWTFPGSAISSEFANWSFPFRAALVC